MLQHKRELFRIEIRRKQLENRFNKNRKLFFSSDYEKLLEKIEIHELELLEIDNQEQATQFAHSQLFIQLKDLVKQCKDRKILNGIFSVFSEFCYHSKENEIQLISDIIPYCVTWIEEISNELQRSPLTVRMFTHILTIFYNSLTYDKVFFLRSLYTFQKLCSIISTLLLSFNNPLDEDGIDISLSLLVRRNQDFNKDDLLVGIKLFNQYHNRQTLLCKKALDLIVQYVYHTDQNDKELLFTHGVISKLDIYNLELQNSSLKLLSLLSEMEQVNTGRLFSVYGIGQKLIEQLKSNNIEVIQDCCFILCNLLQKNRIYTYLVSESAEIMEAVKQQVQDDKYVSLEQ